MTHSDPNYGIWDTTLFNSTINIHLYNLCDEAMSQSCPFTQTTWLEFNFIVINNLGNSNFTEMRSEKYERKNKRF